MCGCKKPKPCGCVIKPMGCKDKDISTDCVLYTGEDLSCLGITKDTILTDVIKQINDVVCAFPTGSLMLENVGGAAGVYKGIGNQGQKQLRTLISASSDLTITQGADTIIFSLAAKGSDIYTTSGVFNSTTSAVTFTRTDSTTYSLDLSPLTQVQANVLETNTASKGFIVNKNPTKTITGNYTILTTDNNYVIEINNSTAVTITIPPDLPNNFFVGFVQKGTQNVTFAGFDIKPLDSQPIIYGQGHNAALEVINFTSYIFGNLRAE